ncbi:MAG: protein kinase [Blautia sp.]|nr:protein kinase [Blautia sp.]MDY5030418.1 protein kinase [Blautia sp.]
MDISRLCPGCMRELERPDGNCPFCGFDRREYESVRSGRALKPGTILNGQYYLGKVLGEGGFGITYIAMDLYLEMPVAVKEYFPTSLAFRDTQSGSTEVVTARTGERRSYFENGLRSFSEEAKKLGKFRNEEGIVQVCSFFYENGTAYMVMEYVDGISLQKYLEQRGVLTEKETLEILMPVMQILIRVHEEGIVHRDISPDNIMIDRSGKVSLIDFGAARMLSSAGTHSITVVLKQGYAPIEQYETHGRQGPWTDVYALCATMYRMMAGKKPQEAVARISGDRVRPLAVLAAENKIPPVSRRVSEAIQKGLSMKAEDRYQNMQELLFDLTKKEDKKETGKRNLAAVGIITACICVAVLIVALFAFRNTTGPLMARLGSGGQPTSTSEPTTMPIPEPTATPTPELTATPIPQKPAFGAFDPAKIQGLGVLIPERMEGQYNIYGPYEYTPDKAMDRDEVSSWQTSENRPLLTAIFDQTRAVRAIRFRVGNWRPGNNWIENSRPKACTVTIGEQEFSLTFPDEQKEFLLMLPAAIYTDRIDFLFTDEYVGTLTDDICVSEITAYGES